MSWPAGISAITLVSEDIAASKEFYLAAFGLPVVFEDDDSVVFRVGDTLVNLLAATAAPELIAPAEVSTDGGSRVVLTVEVDDVDRRVAALRAAGVDLLNGPVDRPWGPRTASFRDPSGHIGEIAS
jgi:catechol 2,3-dioxygenase-like lactoylglutathione lyase family enzyme